MDNFTTTLLAEVESAGKEGRAPSIEAALREAMRAEVERAVNSVVRAELDAFLGYARNEQGAARERGDCRNGSYPRTVATSLGPIEVSVPRDRNGEFSPSSLPKGKRSTDDIGQTILKLYRSGMTDSQIQEIVESLFAHKYSRSAISCIVDAVAEDVRAFNAAPLPERVFALFVDSIYIPLRRGTVQKEAVNIALAITMDGMPTVLGYSITPQESATEWRSVFESLKRRGLRSPRIVISDGVAGIEDAVLESFGNGCLHQLCFVHCCRSLARKARKEDQAELAADFMKIATQDGFENAHITFARVHDKWSRKYKSVGEAMMGYMPSLFSIYHFHQSVRKLIYTTNRIEGLNKQIRRNAKCHISFCEEEAEERFLVTLFNRYNLKVGKRPVRGREHFADELIINV